MTMLIKTNYKTLAAMKLFAGENEIRYYLNSICVDVYDSISALVATNGHTLAAYRVSIENSMPGQYLIPIKLFSRLRKPTKKYPEDDSISVEIDVKKNIAHLHQGNSSAKEKLIDAKFPDWKKIASIVNDGQAAVYAPAYLSRIQKAIDLLHHPGRIIPISCNGGKAGRVNITADFTASIMPVRFDLTDGSVFPPAWVSLIGDRP